MKSTLLSCLLLFAVAAVRGRSHAHRKGHRQPGAHRRRPRARRARQARRSPGIRRREARHGGRRHLLRGRLLHRVVSRRRRPQRQGAGRQQHALCRLFAKDDIKARFTEGRLPNVERRLVEASYMNLPAKSVDLVVIVMAYHDVYWIDEKEGWPEINTDGFLDSLKRMLKPGGKLLIVDHNAAAGTGREAAEQAASPQRAVGAARASPPQASCSRSPTTACAIRRTSSTRWFTTRRSRERPTATCTSTA